MSKLSGFPLEAGWRPLLKDLGVRPEQLFRRADLPEGLLSRLPATLTADEWFRLWTALEVEVGTPTFPLDLIQATSTESLSPPVFAALCSPDLLTAARRLRDYKRLIAPMRLDVDLDATGVNLTFHWLKPPGAIPVSLITFEFAFVTMLARVGTREPLVPVKVDSTVSPPNAAVFATFLGVPIAAGATNTVRFSLEDALRPFLTANDAMWGTFEPALRQRLADLDAGARVSAQVRSALLEGLPSGRSSVEATCKRLAMSTRTLQRQLRAEGTTFGAVLQETRHELALHYLRNTGITATEIGFLLGFDETSSFYRAFRAWTGSTPEATRSELTARR
jgi:AraC-like DNA-binding protein